MKEPEYFRNARYVSVCVSVCVCVISSHIVPMEIDGVFPGLLLCRNAHYSIAESAVLTFIFHLVFMSPYLCMYHMNIIMQRMSAGVHLCVRVRMFINVCVCVCVH